MCDKIIKLLTNHEKGQLILENIDLACKIRKVSLDNIELYEGNFPSLSLKYSKKANNCTKAIDKLLRRYADLMSINNAEIMKEALK